MAYKKPQDPLINNGFGIYPLTTADQVILSDGSRLEKNGQISIGGGTVKTVSGVTPDSAGNVALTASDVGALPSSGTAADSSKLSGKTLAEIMLEFYPVGAVYISVNSTSPASLFGGEWTQINGRFLIGTGAPENNDDGTSPGNYDKTLGNKGGEAAHTLTTNEIPSHNHSLVRQQWYASDSVVSSMSGSIFSWKSNEGGTTSGTYTNTYDIGYTGGSNPHNNLPPYLAVYMWKRVS